MAWFCLKHRKSVGTLLKLGLTLLKKILQYPKFIEHLVQQAEGLVSSINKNDHWSVVVTSPGQRFQAKYDLYQLG